MQRHPLEDKTHKDVLDVLWVGKMDFRKQLGLALRTIAETHNERIALHIVGGGDAAPYKAMAETLGIAKQSFWHGAVSHDEVQRIMQEADVFLMTSVAEGTPHVVLEAIGNNLPVVCFDTCGQGDAVNEAVGRKIPLSTPAQSARGFAAVLNALEQDRTVLRTLSENCGKRQEELSWEAKAQTMVEWYQKIKRN